VQCGHRTARKLSCSTGTEVLADADGVAVGAAADAARRRFHLERAHQLRVVEDGHYWRRYERRLWL
jgi:hypothetical protein